MKTKIFTSIVLCGLMCANSVNADLLFEENFEYDANRALVADAIVSSDNYDGITGWSTQNNSVSNENRFNITDAPLVYLGYPGSDIGYALQYTNREIAGQGVFKALSHSVKNDSTAYIAFLVRFPKTTNLSTGGEYFIGLKMDSNAKETNWGGRVYAAVDPSYTGEEISIGINKMSGGSTTMVGNSGPFLTFDSTYLFVIKYKIGILNGKSADDEAGNYDDVMSLYINPELATEPEKPILTHADASQKDIYRYASSGTVIGGVCSIYLRSAAAGNTPDYIIDGIRAGLTWNDVMGNATGLNNVKAQTFNCFIDGNKQLYITAIASFNEYEILNSSGQQILHGSLNNNTIDASSLSSGIYIIHLNGQENAVSKFIVR